MDKPTEPGWFWYSDDGWETSEVLEVVDNCGLKVTSCDMDSYFPSYSELGPGQWRGPIDPDDAEKLKQIAAKIDHWESQSKLFNDDDIRGPMMALAVQDIRRILEPPKD